MPSQQQLLLDAYLDAMETDLGVDDSLDPVKNPKASSRNATRLEAVLADIVLGWDDWAVNTVGALPSDRDDTLGDSRSRVDLQALQEIFTKKAN